MGLCSMLDHLCVFSNLSKWELTSSWLMRVRLVNSCAVINTYENVRSTLDFALASSTSMQLQSSLKSKTDQDAGVWVRGVWFLCPIYLAFWLDITIRDLRLSIHVPWQDLLKELRQEFQIRYEEAATALRQVFRTQPLSLRGINMECKLQLHRAVLNKSGSARGYDRSSCKRTRRWVRSCSCKDANRLTSTDTKLTKFSNSNTRKSNKSLLALWIR